MSKEGYLTRPAEYAIVHEKGRSWADRTVVARVRQNGLEVSRFGFSVSRRVGGAVVRNRIKRYFREVTRQAAVKPGWDIVLIARQPAAGSGYWDIKGSLEGLFRRAGILEG